MNKFESIDYSDKNAFDRALDEYKFIIKPVLKEYGIEDTLVSKALTESINYRIKSLKSLNEGRYKDTILSISKVRKIFGNSKNNIDVCR